MGLSAVALAKADEWVASRQAVVEHCHVVGAAVPELHHVGLRGAADGDEALRPLREIRQDVRKIEHPHRRILARHVEVRKVVHRRRCRQRIPSAHAPVRGADHEAVEVAPMAANPERQAAEVP